MHQQLIEDTDGQLIDVIEFCSDYCHKEHAGSDYAGWNGCHEAQFDTACQNCGATIEGVEQKLVEALLSYCLDSRKGKLSND